MECACCKKVRHQKFGRFAHFIFVCDDCIWILTAPTTLKRLIPVNQIDETLRSHEN